MGKRGRKSLASQSVVSLSDAIERVQRPDAPYDLTDEQADVWRGVVADLPADWFSPKNFMLLTQYCRHVIEARRIAQLIQAEMDASEGIDLVKYDKLLAMQEREGRAISSLMTRMRTTHQSLYDKSKKVGSAVRVSKPWDVEA